jgi:hypothetical protein
VTTGPAAFRTEVLLSFQRALWDLITPPLRAVAVRPSFPFIEARFIYEWVAAEEREIAAEAEAYLVADFLPPVDVRFTAVAAGPADERVLEDGEEWVYRRREADSP